MLPESRRRKRKEDLLDGYLIAVWATPSLRIPTSSQLSPTLAGTTDFLARVLDASNRTSLARLTTDP